MGGRCGSTRDFASSVMRFLDHAQQRPTLGRNPAVEWSARLRDLWQHKTLPRDRHPCHRRNSKPHSQQASGSRPTP